MNSTVSWRFNTAGKSDYNQPVSWNYTDWNVANQTDLPSGSRAETMQTLMATESKPLTIDYENDTDAAQENSRTYQFIFEEETY